MSDEELLYVVGMQHPQDPRLQDRPRHCQYDCLSQCCSIKSASSSNCIDTCRVHVYRKYAHLARVARQFQS